MTLIQKLAELNLFIAHFDHCKIVQDDIKYHMKIDDIPFKLLLTDIVKSQYDVKNEEYVFFLRSKYHVL